MEEKKTFTLMFLPSDPADIRKYMISGTAIKVLTVIAAVFLMVAVVLYLDYVRVKRKEIDLIGLTDQMKRQNLELQTYVEKINGMEQELERLKKNNEASE